MSRWWSAEPPDSCPRIRRKQGQVEAGAISAGGIERRVEVGPLVGAPHDLGWAKTLRTAPPVSVDQLEVHLEGQDVKRLAGGGAPLALYAHLLGELF